MNENSFNVCSRCGSANPLSARYCYQCGYELKSPEAPVVCTKCNTVNQGSANFCKRCGSKLPKAQSKFLCPQCSASNNAGTTYCVNCGFDFTTSTMPSSVALAGKTVAQPQLQQPVAAADTVVAQSQDKKLTRKEKKRLKREEEERRYREQVAARKQAKIDKKQAKKDAKAQAKANKKQVVAQQPVQPVVQYPVIAQQPVQAIQYMPPVVQQIVVEPPKETKVKKHRIKNLVVFLIALVGLYLILLPEQANLLKQFALLTYTSESVAGVRMTGWDVILAVLSNFVPTAAGLSTVASTYKFDSIEMLLTGVVMAVVVLELVVIILAKILGMITGKAHKGIDLNAIGMFVVTSSAFAYAYLHGISTIVFSKFALVVPLVFLAIAIFNTKFKKENK